MSSKLSAKYYSLVVSMMASVMLVSSPVAYAASAEKDEKEASRAVELNGMVFPVFEGGRIRNYLFVNSRLIVKDGKSTWEFRDQSHFIRDAVLAALHEESSHLDGHVDRLDEGKAQRICIDAANAYLGEDIFTSMTFQQVESQGAFD